MILQNKDMVKVKTVVFIIKILVIFDEQLYGYAGGL